jgi:membrane protease YdiL (CAAX protease family)
VLERVTQPGVGLDLRPFFRPHQAALVAGCALAVAVADIMLAHFVAAYVYSWTRAILPIAALLLLDGQRRRQPGSGWPSSTPYGGWRLWGQISLLVMALALLFWGALAWLSSMVAWLPRLAQLDPHDLPAWLLYACVLAPLFEEGVYRLLLCTALATCLRQRTVILISGTLFALLHIAYGNFALTNGVAGYLLAWAYVKSGSLWLPILWHSVGNLAILLAQVVLFQLAAN